MKPKPSATMMRKAQNSGQTVGTVSFDACDDLFFGRLARVFDIFLQQEGKAQVGRVFLERRA